MILRYFCRADRRDNSLHAFAKTAFQCCRHLRKLADIARCTESNSAEGLPVEVDWQLVDYAVDLVWDELRLVRHTLRVLGYGRQVNVIFESSLVRAEGLRQC